MTQLSIQLVLSVTGAVIATISLLLVAVIIGYVTSWFYAKSVYNPIIRGLETEKADLGRQISGLNDEVAKLNAKVEKLNGKVSKLEEEVGEKDKEIKKLSKSKK